MVENTGKVTPATVEITPGYQEVVFKKAGYEDKKVTVKAFKSGVTYKVDVILTKKAAAVPKTYISCRTTPSGAEIWIKKS